MKISAFLLYNSPGSCKVITAMGSGAISICRLWSFELWSYSLFFWAAFGQFLKINT